MEGALESAEQTRRAYALLGVPERVEAVVAEGPHGFLPLHRVAVANWFRRWLCGEDNPQSVDWGAELTLEDPETLWATPQGQSFYLGSRTVFSFTRREAQRLRKERRQWFVKTARDDIPTEQEELRDRLSELLRVDVPQENIPMETEQTDSQDGVILSSLRYFPEPGIEIPAIWMRSDKNSERAAVFVSEDESAVIVRSRTELRELATNGVSVLVIEMRGKGSTLSAPCRMSSSYRRLGVEGYHLFNYGMVGRSFLGCRVLDILAGVNCMRQLTGLKDVEVIGEDLAALAALMAAALDTGISKVQLRRLLVSYHALAVNEFREQPPGVFVSGILQVCDLPEVAACVAPRPLKLVSVVDEFVRCFMIRLPMNMDSLAKCMHVLMQTRRLRSRFRSTATEAAGEGWERMK